MTKVKKRDLVPLAQFKKREKHLWGVLISVKMQALLKVTFLHGCFSQMLPDRVKHPCIIYLSVKFFVIKTKKRSIHTKIQHNPFLRDTKPKATIVFNFEKELKEYRKYRNLNLKVALRWQKMRVLLLFKLYTQHCSAVVWWLCRSVL